MSIRHDEVPDSVHVDRPILLARTAALLLTATMVLPCLSDGQDRSVRPLQRASDPLAVPSAFPRADYTPFGYIDNPYHSMVAHRSGILRSVPPLGMGWWKTDFAGSYGSGARDHVNYTSFLQLALTSNGRAFITEDDFRSQGIELVSAYHTHHLLSYDWIDGQLGVSVRYFLPRENTLACLVQLTNASSEAATVRLDATNAYGIGPQKWWGSNGLTSRHRRDADVAVSKVWAYGDVFVLGSTTPSVAHGFAEEPSLRERWIRHGDTSSTDELSFIGRGPIRVTERSVVTVPAQQRMSVVVFLSRGPSEDAALEEFRIAQSSALDSLGLQLADDNRFWTTCPILEGDWPVSWKRGWVYDFETLRMTVRPPIGIFKHPWDGMQIHSPRLVLGETAIDMMTLSYADPGLAKEVIYGTFADAIAPNIPCVREDGSVNMVGADGSECGTAPMWGYPFHVIDAIYRATGDRNWIRSLYPHLQAYLDWWLEHRTDAEGWLHCNNSWESGQDGSRRFIVAESNEGAPAEFVRTVDVEASMAEALAFMARIAPLVGHADDQRRWRALAQQRTRNARSMFFDGWFRDVDGRTGLPIILKDYYDVSMLAPLACNVATTPQSDSLRPMFDRLRKTLERWLEWPPGMMTFTEAAWHAGKQMQAAEAVASTVERVYRKTDARQARRGSDGGELAYRIPGVANEFWPVRDVAPGGENYGWGATLPMHILRTIVGFREADTDSADGFLLAPCLPPSFMRPGSSYIVKHLRFRDFVFDVTYVCRDDKRIQITLQAHGDREMSYWIESPGGTAAARSEHGLVTFDAMNAGVYAVRMQ